MQITYRNDAQSGPVVIEGLYFDPGQSHDVDDAKAASILTNANFVDESGKNPNFVCGDCGKETFALAKLGPNELISLRHADGKLRCEACFKPSASLAEVLEADEAPAAPAEPDDSADTYSDRVAKFNGEQSHEHDNLN